MQVASRAAAEAARQTAAANEALTRIRDGFAGGMADMASTLQQLVRCPGRSVHPPAGCVAMGHCCFSTVAARGCA